MIQIFKCPYWDECFKEIKGEYMNNEPVIRFEFPTGCKHPFLYHGKTILCGLSMDDDGDYDKIISQLKIKHHHFKKRRR